jgi:RNA polymerase sigma-70 factor (ECF subfamily)
MDLVAFSDRTATPGAGLAAGYHRARRPVLPGARQPATDRSPTEVSPLPESRSPDDVSAEREVRRAEDAALLARIVARDEGAIESLYTRYSGPLYALAYRVTQADRFDPSRGSVAPWLFSLARHKAIDLVRREANVRKRTADVDLELEVANDDVDREVWLSVRRDRVRAAMDGLSDIQRTALELAFFNGLTHVEVAEQLGIPLGTAKTRIRTALLKLRDMLGTELSEHEDDDLSFVEAD